MVPSYMWYVISQVSTGQKELLQWAAFSQNLNVSLQSVPEMKINKGKNKGK
jgi:hypothetical protein